MTKTQVEFELVEFDPKTAGAEDWALVHAFRRARLTELDRTDELFPDADFEAMAKRDDPFGEYRRLLVKSDGQVVGSFRTYLQYPDTPGYESSKHLLYVDAGVLGAYRRRGIGSALLRRVLTLLEETDKTVVTFGTEEEEGHAFLKHIGAEAKLEGAENRLYLDNVDWAMVAGWVKEGRERSPQTELIFFEERVPEDRFDEIAPVLTELLNTMPFDDLDHGEIVLTPEHFRDWYGRMDELGSHHHMYLTKEPDGAISGMTDVQWTPQTPDRISQNFTGVHPAYRGRGLGKLLKASMLEYTRQRYPQVRFVATGNANSNDPMLAINQKLGFKKHRGGTSYQMSREALQKYVASIS